MARLGWPQPYVSRYVSRYETGERLPGVDPVELFGQVLASADDRPD